jgi:hypothetical protein
VELGTRAHDPEIRALLVQCLNDFQEVIRTEQAKPEHAAIIDLLRKKGETSQQLSATTVKDKIDLVTFETIEGKREPKPRGLTYAEEEWDGRGRPKRAPRKNYNDEYGFDDDFVEDDVPKSDDGDWAADNLTELSDTDPLDYDEDASDSELEGATEEQVRKHAAKKEAQRAMDSEAQEDEGLRRLKLILSADPGKVYTEEDLEREDILIRSLELAYCARAGLPYDRPPSVHIEVSRGRKTIFFQDTCANSGNSTAISAMKLQAKSPGKSRSPRTVRSAFWSF